MMAIDAFYEAGKEYKKTQGETEGEFQPVEP